MKADSVFAELKRRNVFRAGAFYAASAWLLVQVATQVFPFFHISEWLVRWIILAAVIGFPFWLVLAWLYQWTARGLQRESDSAAPLSRSSRKSRRNVDRWIIVMLAAAVVLLLADKFLFRDRATKASGVVQKSIAVLPFDNLSRDPDNAYFCEGVQDEILTRLAKVADLKVISRTSTQHFKSTPDDVPQIAKQLGVANILEGSVQKANDQVRVNVQLINAMTDAHLWADTYDRKLTDIFSVESDIAKTIADTLRAKLTGSEEKAIAKIPTSNNEAYELYLKGRFFWNKRKGADLKRAIDYFNQAVERDPNYALAYSGLADSYLLLSVYGAGSPRDSIPQAKAAARKALDLDNTLPEAHASWGRILSGYDFAFKQGIAEFERAIELNPNYATAHHWLSNTPLVALGDFDRAISEGKRSVELDPLSMINNADLGNSYFYARRYDEAVSAFKKAIEIDPGSHLAHYYLGEVLQQKGQGAEAMVEYKRAVELDDDPEALALVGQACARSGKRNEADQIFARITEEAKTRYVSAYNMALMFLGLGEKDNAIAALERAYGEGAGNDIYCIRVDPMVDELRKDARFEALAEKIVPAAQFRAASK
jgi:TolB-like protein/Tfp pilus assembly protein PilF